MPKQKTINESLDSAKESVVTAFGSDLISLVHHGSTVEQDGDSPIPRLDSICLLLVLGSVESTELIKLSKLDKQLTDPAEFNWLVLTEAELSESTDVFPDMFLEMKRRSEVIFGLDLISELDIRQHHLRLRCEQQFKLLLFEMQHDLMARPNNIKARLSTHYQRLIQLASSALWLMGVTPPSDSETLLRYAAEHFGFSIGALTSVEETIASKDLQRAKHLEAQVALLKIVREAAKLLDGMDDEIIVIESD